MKTKACEENPCRKIVNGTVPVAGFAVMGSEGFYSRLKKELWVGEDQTCGVYN